MGPFGIAGLRFLFRGGGRRLWRAAWSQLEDNCKKALEVLKANFSEGSASRRTQTAGYHILGGYATSERCGLTSGTQKFMAAIKELNAGLRTWLPGQTWTSLCINFNERIALHADLGNLPGTLNHSIFLGDFTKGALWIGDPAGDERRSFDGVEGQLRGRCVDTRCQFFSFDARSSHYVEEWAGVRWSLTAYTDVWVTSRRRT